jgi:phage terminase large subunit-like protein
MSAAPAIFEIDPAEFEKLSPAEQDQAIAQLRTAKELMKQNPLLGYVPHEGEKEWKIKEGIELDGTESRGQMEFHEIKVPYGAYVGGNRSGKTHCGSADILIQALPEEFIPPWLRPYKRWGIEEQFKGRVVGVDLAYWLNSVVLPKLRGLVPREALWKGSWEKAWSDRLRKLQFERGDYIDFLTHDMDVDAFAGAEKHMVWFDEEPPGDKGRQQYEESLGRVAEYDGDIRWTLTPLLGLSFVYHELTDGFGNPRDDDECKVIRGDIDHNPHLSEKGRKRFLKRFEKEPLKLQARKEGRWVHFAGQIYPEFAERVHVQPARAIPRASEQSMPAVPIYGAIDPGINEDHKVGIVFAWLDGKDVLEVFHAHKESGWTVEDTAAHFHNVCAALHFKPRWTVIDPSARNKAHATGRSVQDEYRKHGIHTIPGQNSREAGFNAVKERLRTERLVLHGESCDQLIHEFHEYRWKRSRGRSEDAPKAEPIKINDDLLDALRYLVMSMPRGPEPVEQDPDRGLSDADRSFRQSLRRLRKPKRPRIGGFIPA